MADSTAELGRTVGKYEILSPLAEGSVTALFIAKPDIGSQAVGLEQLVRGVRGDATCTRLFLEEAALTAKLVHPNVIRAHELAIDRQRGDPYRVVELISGQSLALLMKTVSALPLPVACRIVHDACLGLQAAHAMGVTHGSLTPQCLKLTYQGEVKLTDFGLSNLRRALRLAHPGQAFGTLAYLAPEQVMEHPVDARTDVFAMATLLWELITGRRMHENEAAAPRAVVVDRPPPPGSLVAGVPAKLDALVLEGLEKNPELRQDSAGALARALASAGPLATQAQVAGLMETLFADRRRSFEALLARLTAEAPEEITATGLPDEPTGPLPIMREEERTGPIVVPRQEERTRVDRPAPPALSDETPEPTVQANAFDFPPAPRPARPSAPPDIFATLAPAPSPSRGGNAFEGLPPSPRVARAPVPQPSESLPQGNVFDDLPATPSVVIDEPIMAPPAPESPRARASAPRPEPARPPPPVPTVEVERPSALMVAYDRARWVLALGLLAAAIAVVSTWWIKNPPQRPRPPAAQALD